MDDYAHHPSEIKATLKAARETEPKRLICVFQPHRYTRTQLLCKEFGGAFGDADLLVLTGIYSAGEDPIDGVSSELILSEVEDQTGQDVTYIPEWTKLASYLAGIVKPGDLVITMGAGNIYQTGEELAKMLEEKEA